eukprot:m.110098 g.110098  ORF g.110098 m.110098 type:complete len:77 (-) comp9216_c1_seq3:605-835(-)
MKRKHYSPLSNLLAPSLFDKASLSVCAKIDQYIYSQKENASFVISIDPLDSFSYLLRTSHTHTHSISLSFGRCHSM